MKKILFISIWQQGDGLSGGDRIWIEFAKKWKNKLNVDLLGSPEAKKISERYGLLGIKLFCVVKKITTSNNLSVLNLVKNLISRTITALYYIKKNELYKEKYDYIYSTSDFWPDSLAAFYLKLKNKKIIWVAGFYLFAPKPWQKESPYKGRNFIKGLLYFLIQYPVYIIVKRYADIVFVTSEPDVSKFVTNRRKENEIIIIQGGVDVTASEKYLSSHNVIPIKKRKYDACFIGRLHHQKGVVGLIEIWRRVCLADKNRRLLIIGDGELEGKVRENIVNYNLEKNIEMVGFADGEKKFDLIKQSKIVVHPATYDSGGMAAAEAMAWGVPGISYDLEALKTYYPKGMLKVAIGDIDQFSKKIYRLLNNHNLYNKTSKDAHDLIIEVWDWNKRAKNILAKLSKIK